VCVCVCVSECDREASIMWKAWSALGIGAKGGKNAYLVDLFTRHILKIRGDTQALPSVV